MHVHLRLVVLCAAALLGTAQGQPFHLPTASRAIFERDGTYERAIVTLVRRVAPTPSSVSSRG